MDITEIPVIRPPHGVQSNFDHPKTLGTSIIVINAIFVPLMLIAVAVRLYSRGHLMHALGWDDYTCALAALSSIAHSVIGSYNTRNGFGEHMWDMRLISLRISHLRQIIATAILYPVAVGFIKISLFLLYLRLFGVTRRFRYLCYFGMVLCFAYYTAYLGTQVAIDVHCVTVADLNRPICKRSYILTALTASFNVFTDFYTLALPIRPVLSLKLRFSQKLGLLCIFMAGLIACLVSVARLVYVCVYLRNADVLYTAALIYIFSVVEINVAIITGSVPGMPHFFAQSRIFRQSTYSSLRLRLFSSSRGERIRSTSTGSSSNRRLLKERWSSSRSDRPISVSQEKRESEKPTPGPDGLREARLLSTTVVSQFRPFPGDDRDTFLDDATSMAGLDGSEDSSERVFRSHGGVVATPAGQVLGTVGYSVDPSVRTGEEGTRIAREIFDRRGVRFHRLA